MTCVVVQVEGVFPDLLRLKAADWLPAVPVYVLRRSLPPDVEAKLLTGGYLFVDASYLAHPAYLR
jgi:hypothetical protein